MTRVPEGDEEAALRRRLREVEAEHADLLGKTMGEAPSGIPISLVTGKTSRERRTIFASVWVKNLAFPRGALGGAR